ncbi:outer membrane beta-barrel protein [uncultured Alistipes sp.]|uniref:outer membrane beta-barrel protein n=1 Tax=uncultured Alistipes sp. TaxID=538949 RepID=UPI0026221698|nr:outer membrane beta-barrel protein [uncultured Alistipes sp.]
MKKTLCLVVFVVWLSTLCGQSPDTVNQKREVFIEEGRFRDGEKNKRVAGESKLVVAIDDFSKKSGSKKSSHRNRFVWNDGHWAGIGVHYSGLITNLGNLNLPADAQFLTQSAKSIGVSINPVDYTLVKYRRFGLITGLGVEFNNFRFDDNVALKYQNGVMGPDPAYEGIHIAKSKLYTCYLNVPLLVEFQMGRRNHFFINAGVVGGWRMGAHTKVKAVDDRLRGTFKDRGNMGLRNFHYGYTVHIGYDHFAVSGTYYRPSIFRKGHGPQVEQVNIGLTLMW